MFDFRVEIYKKMVLEKENSKFEKSIGEIVQLKNHLKKLKKSYLPTTPGQKELNNFLKQIKEEQKNIDIVWFKNEFNYETPDKMLKYLHSLKKMMTIIKQHLLLKNCLQIVKLWLKLCQKVIKKQGNKNIEYC